MVGGRTVAGDGGDVADQGTARLRAAADSAGSLLVSCGRMGRTGTAAFARPADWPNRMADRAQPMALQLEIAGCDPAWRSDLLRAVRDLSRAHRFRKGFGDGVPRKRRAFFSSLRPSRPHLSLLLRDLCADDPVVGVAARRARRGPSQARRRGYG